MILNCSINGRSVSPSAARISVFDNSLFYADGLFETLLAINNRVLFLDEHLERLKRGARLIRLRLPVELETIKRWIKREVSRNKASVKKIRLTITSGDSGFWAGHPSKPRVIIIVTEHAIARGPYRLAVSPFRIDENSPFRSVKTLSFIIEMTSRKGAYASQYDDAVLLNRRGHLAEATSANIFWVRKGILYTPPISAGCLDGMIRRHVLKLAPQEGYSIREKNAGLKELLKADEIFITSSLKLIIPVTAVKAEKIHTFVVGPVTTRMRRLLDELIFQGG